MLSHRSLIVLEGLETHIKVSYESLPNLPSKSRERPISRKPQARTSFALTHGLPVRAMAAFLTPFLPPPCPWDGRDEDCACTFLAYLQR